MYTEHELLHTTFGGAWRRLLRDLNDMKQLTNDTSPLKAYRYDRGLWHRISDLEVRIMENVDIMPKHPLFKHMAVHTSLGFPTSFKARWEELKNLSSKWRESEHIWNETAKLYGARNWIGQADLIDLKIKLKHAVPVGYDRKFEWSEDSLPSNELMKPGWMLDLKGKAQDGSIIRTSTV